MRPNIPFRTPVRHAGVSWAMAALMVIAACISFAPGLRADDQTEQEAVAILIFGKWYFSGQQIARTFNRDGTYTSDNGTTGTWKINEGALEIMLGTRPYRFPLPIDPHGTWGVTRGKQALLIRVGESGPKQPAPALPDNQTPDEESAPGPMPPVGANTQQSASQIIQAYNNSLVFVTGKEGAGSGFIATINGGNFLVTNAHVAAGIQDAEFKTLDGTVVHGGAASMAIGEDIFCMALPPGGKPFEIMQGVDENAAIGDAVVVLGNAEGQGVVNTIIGKIVGIGPNLVEIDAPFVPGNSGSPIIDLKSGKVIGVATYLVTNQYDLTTDQKLKQPVVRRFGYRLDSVKGWQAVNWREFNAQAAEMQSIDTLTKDLYDFFRDLDEHKGIVTLGRHTNPIIKDRIDDWVAAKGSHPSAEDANEADANFISFLRDACEADVDAAQRQITYDYFRRELGEQKQIRDEMAKALQEAIQELGQ